MNRKILASLFVFLFTVPMLAAPGVRAAPLLDVMFVIDGSGSITDPDYIEMLDAVKGYAGTLAAGVPADPGPPPSPALAAADLRAGIVQFSTSVFLHLGLTGNLSVFNATLDNIPQQFGQTNHADAFTTAAAELAANGRAGARQAIILITDGKANEPVSGPVDPVTAAINAANAAIDDGIDIFTIGVGNSVDMPDLEDYASGAEFTALVSDFSDLASVNASIAEEFLPEATVSVDAPAPLAILGLGIAGLACWRRSARA